MDVNSDNILHFLKTVFFYDYSDIFKASSNRAYQDFCRTIRVKGFKEKTDSEKEEARAAVTDYLKDRITGIDGGIKTIHDQAGFDFWHHETCERIIEKFKPCAQLNYGQAQKWLNMTFKYLRVLDEPNVKYLFPWLHAPIDTLVFDRAAQIGVQNTTKQSWSNWDYDKYKDYQKKLRTAIKQIEGEDYPVLLWEWLNWKPEQS